MDFRKLNDVTCKDAYPLPRIDTMHPRHACRLQMVQHAGPPRWLYWQVQIVEGDRPKTAFCTTDGLFQFKVMPFGLCNAPATFQRLMDLVLAGLQWSQCLVYLDDVIVLGRTFDEHLSNLESVFRRLREAGLCLKPSKCSLFPHKVQYLGHVISRKGIAADPTKKMKATSTLSLMEAAV